MKEIQLYICLHVLLLKELSRFESSKLKELNLSLQFFQIQAKVGKYKKQLVF